MILNRRGLALAGGARRHRSARGRGLSTQRGVGLGFGRAEHQCSPAVGACSLRCTAETVR